MATIMGLSADRFLIISATSASDSETIDLGIIDDGTESSARAISTLQYDYAQDPSIFSDNGLDVTSLQIVDHNSVTTEAPPSVQASSSLAVTDTSAIIAAVLIPVGTILIIIAIIAIYEYRKRWKARHSGGDVEMANVKSAPPASPKKTEPESGESSGDSGESDSKSRSESSDEGSSSDKEDPKNKKGAKTAEIKKTKESSEEESASASKQSESQSESGSESD